MPRSVRQEAEKAKLNKVQVSNLVNMSRYSKDSKSCVIEAIKRGLSTQCKRSLINPRFQLGDGGCRKKLPRTNKGRQPPNRPRVVADSVGEVVQGVVAFQTPCKRTVIYSNHSNGVSTTRCC